MNILSRNYWRTAAAELKSLRTLLFAALMIAAAIALGWLFKIPLAENLSITVSYLARAVAALVCGPVVGLLYGFAEDILSWILKPSGAFFPGYTLNTMLGVFVYALCFYKQRLTILRIVVAKLITNYPISVGLGCLWSQMLYGRGYLYYLGTSLVKNTLYCPIQIVMLLIVFQALLPTLKRLGLVDKRQPDHIPWN